MKKCNYFEKASVFLAVSTITFRSIIDKAIFNNAPVALLALAIIFLAIGVIKTKIKPKIDLIIYPVLLILISIPLNPILFEDGQQGYMYAYYIEALVYGLIISFSKNSKQICILMLRLFGYFALVTSAVTWMSALLPNAYVERIIPLFPKSNQQEMKIVFEKLSVKPGLTTHYTHNATFITIGTIAYISNYIKTKEKKHLLITIALIATLFLVGKRAHVLFLILSQAISYLMRRNGLKVSSIIKLSCITIASILLALAITTALPQTNYLIERLQTNGESDLSSGRFEMYKDGLRQLNDGSLLVGIGWGRYAYNTNYTHPTLHNDYLQSLVETGIIGALIFISYTIVIAKNSYKYIKISNKDGALAYAITSFTLFVLFYSLTGSPRFDIDTLLLFQTIQSVSFSNKEEKELS